MHRHEGLHAGRPPLLVDRRTALGVCALLYADRSASRTTEGRCCCRCSSAPAVAAIVGPLPGAHPGRARPRSPAPRSSSSSSCWSMGAPAAVIAAALEGFVASYRASKRWTSRIVTPAMAVARRCSAAQPAFEMRARSSPGSMAMHSAALLALVIVVRRRSTSPRTRCSPPTLIALKRDSPLTPRSLAARTCGWIGPRVRCRRLDRRRTVALSFEQFGLPALHGRPCPLIAMFLSTLHTYFQRKGIRRAPRGGAEGKRKPFPQRVHATPPSAWRW